jgi:hypothetical protein
MKQILLILVTASLTMLNAHESDEFMASITATYEARETLVNDLKKDQGSYRSEFTGCPSREQFNKILQDEARYNEAARAWLKQMRQ